jgi:YggT family protein
MLELLGFISYLIQLYEYVVIAAVVISWLVAFNVINSHNPFVRSLLQFIRAVTEPLLAPIRRMMPDLGGMDISPIILLLGCLFLRAVVIPNIAKVVV